jgi:type II secretory pathway pseudopilin PulG
MNKSVGHNGFTLIEFAIIMTIVGLLAAGFFSTLEVQLRNKKIETTKDRTLQNSEVLYRFATTAMQKDSSGNLLLDAYGNPIPEKRLPCPSNINTDYGGVGFGVEQCPSMTAPAGSVFNGVRVAVNPAGQRIFIGALPINTLETNGDNAKDAYKSKYIYAVSAALTQVGSVTSTTPTGGAIHVITNPGSVIPSTVQAPFVIVAPGISGLNTIAGSDDAENTDNDHIFNAFSGHTTIAGASYYDDTVSFEFPSAINPQFCISSVNVQEFTTPGTHTWTKPTNVMYAVIEISGADGGHRSAAGSSTSCGAEPGGGDGGEAIKVLKESALPSTVTVTVGHGGQGSSSCAGSGGMPFHKNGVSDGGTTSFGSLVTLTGGKKGLANGAKPAGTATGADYFSTKPSGTNSGQSGCNWHSSCQGGGSCNDYCSTHAGWGDDGYLKVTSYLCN